MHVEDQIRAMVNPLLVDLCVDLWDVEWNGSRLRILVDTAQGIDTETLGFVSQVLSSELDKSDPVPEKYTLELSSPGLERTLRHPEHFVSYIGSEVMIKLTSPMDGKWRLTGVLEEVLEDGVRIKQEQTAVHVLFSEIKKAQLVYKWNEDKRNENKGAESERGIKNG